MVLNFNMKLKSQKVIDIELFGHRSRQLDVGLDLIDEFFFRLSAVPLAHVQRHLHRALHPVLVQRDVVMSEQLLALRNVLYGKQNKIEIIF